MTAPRKVTRHRGAKKGGKAAATKGKKRAGFAGMPTRDPLHAAVQALAAETDPKKRWELEQKIAMAEAVRLATEDGKRQAERDYELARRHPGERLGAGELVDLLMRNNPRGK